MKLQENVVSALRLKKIFQADRHYLADAGYLNGLGSFTLTDSSLEHTIVGSSCENKITTHIRAGKMLKKRQNKERQRETNVSFQLLGAM